LHADTTSFLSRAVFVPLYRRVSLTVHFCHDIDVLTSVGRRMPDTEWQRCWDSNPDPYGLEPRLLATRPQRLIRHPHTNIFFSGTGSNGYADRVLDDEGVPTDGRRVHGLDSRLPSGQHHRSSTAVPHRVSQLFRFSRRIASVNDAIARAPIYFLSLFFFPPPQTCIARRCVKTTGCCLKTSRIYVVFSAGTEQVILE
jgi:hypothetical protein